MSEMMIEAIAFQQLDTLDSKILEKTFDSKSTLKVEEGTPALQVAKDAARMKAGLIMTLDLNGNVTGIVSPDWVCHQYSRVKNIKFQPFLDVLRIMEKDPEERDAGYRHEWLNFDRPDLYLCPEGHFVSSRPCPEHNR